MQTGFFSNCNDTLIVQRVLARDANTENMISLITRLIQIRSFMMMFFALIIMLQDREPSSSVTFIVSMVTAFHQLSTESVETEVEILHPFLACSLVPLHRDASHNKLTTSVVSLET